MPLMKGSSDKAFKTNVHTLMDEWKAGTSKHVQSQKQALAIAYSLKRRGRAMGGPASPPWYVRNEARNLMHTGPIVSTVPGRTDRHSMNVPSGSYVLPAETVSHLGQNNTLAGMNILNKMFHSGPYGSAMPGGHPHPPHFPTMPKMRMSDEGGGRGEGTGEPVPVETAGGEFTIHPDIVKIIGGGDLAHGHAVLDAWVMKRRKDHIATLKGLKPPVKS